MRLPNLRVLAAEDNSVNQLVLKTLPHQLGVDPVVVDNGAKAVEAARLSATLAQILEEADPAEESANRAA